jgi:hypothetical protein
VVVAGAASVFLTDAPRDDFDEILVTITCLQLLGGGAPVSIFCGRETVDLKDLENFSDLFVYAEDVPVGTYSKIRMCVNKIELVDDGSVTELDPPGTFLHLKGIIESEVDAVDEFDFEIARGQGFGDASVVTALLQDGTRIFSRAGFEIDEDEIIPDTGTKIDGVFATDSAGTFDKAALLVLDLEIGSAGLLRGEILTANEKTRQLLLGAQGGSECVDVPEETGTFLIRANGSGGSSEEGDFDDLTPGLRASIYGAFEGVGGCFIADEIIAFPIDYLDSAECPYGQFCSKDADSCEERGCARPQRGSVRRSSTRYVVVTAKPTRIVARRRKRSRSWNPRALVCLPITVEGSMPFNASWANSV